MLENRQATGRDSALPGSGLAVWHINESLSSNSNSNAYVLGLVQVDGARGLELAVNGGDANDLLPGGLGKTKFNASTKPRSHAQGGAPTGVSLSKISLVDAEITVAVKR